MTGISIRFETRELDGREVLVLRYRLKRFVVVRFFTETYDPCTGEVCSAMDNMMGFVYRLMSSNVLCRMMQSVWQRVVLL